MFLLAMIISPAALGRLTSPLLVFETYPLAPKEPHEMDSPVFRIELRKILIVGNESDALTLFGNNLLLSF